MTAHGLRESSPEQGWGREKNFNEKIAEQRQMSSSQLGLLILIRIAFTFAFHFSERIIIYLKNGFAQASEEPQACVCNCRVISPEYNIFFFSISL